MATLLVPFGFILILFIALLVEPYVAHHRKLKGMADNQRELMLARLEEHR